MSSDIGVCDKQTVSYSHRVYDADNYDWCIVPDTGYDVILLAGIAVVVACICQGRLSNLMVLVAGGALQGILFPLNLGRLGNSVSLWLNIEPYELFFYVFLPPLLLDAAVKLDFFLFKKVAVHCIALAFLVVAGSCALLIPVMLYIFQLHTHGWQWPHAALFGSMLASTDAVAIVATMKTAGGPHHLQVLLEGESLLNDATSITLFLVFLKEVQDLQSQTNPPKVGAHEFGVIVGNIIWLSVGGMLIGLAFGVTVRWLLSWMRQRDAGRDQQICLTLAVAYLSFYVANSPANVSGVIAVVTYGLYGAYTTNWDMDVHILESGAFDSFYESLAFLVNGIIFFYSGVSCVNFVVRSTEDLYLNSPISEAAAALWRLPLIYIVFNCIRFIVIFALRPLFKLLHRDLSTKEVVFASIAGLRGSVSLIMAQAFVTESSTTTPEARMIKAELVLWVAGFVLLSLIINAPMLPWIMRITRLNTVPEGKLRMRRKAVIALAAHKQEGLQQLKDDPDEMLRGVDWSLVAEHVSMDNAYEQFLDPEASQSQQQGWMQNFKGWVWSQKPLKEDRSAPQTPGTLTPHSHRGVPGQGYDPNASWSKASNSAAGSSVDASNMSSSSSGSSKSSGSNSAALSYQGTSFRGTVDEANLAAAVAAVAVAAEAAIEPDDAIDELPYLADTAVVDADATAMVDDQTEAEPNSAVAAVQAGIDTFAGAIKGLFGNKARSDPGLLEVSVVADGSASPRKDEEMEIPTGPQGKSLGTSSLRQKSKSEKRARLLLLANGLFMPMPVNQQQPAAANLQEDKQLIADSLKPVHASATPAKHTRKGSEAFVRFEAAPAAADTAEQSVMESQASVKVAVASSADALSAGNLRRASVTSKGSDAQVSVSALRSKSFSAGSKAPASSAEGRVSPTAASVSRESPFHKVARSQMSQHVERSSASATVHGSAGSVAAQLLDQLKGLRPGHSSQHDMHHPSTVTPHPHASAPSEAGSTFGQHGPSSHHGSEADDLAVADMRVRLLAGLKRYLHGKRLNGLLSSEGLRVLDNACETAAEHAAEHPEDPLDVWRLVERDCRGSWGVKLLARAVYQLHRLHQRLRRAVGPHPRLLWPLSRCIALGSQQLSKRLLLACEVAMELMLSLTYAHQVQWLQRHRPSHQLLTEVHEQSQKAWAFIIAREVEAPQRFQAIQSHRAAQAILHQQTQYVTHLLETAVVAEDDGRHLLRPIQQRERQLVDMGPTWRTPSVAGVLRNLPFMRHSPPQVLEVLLQHGRLKMGHKQQPLRSKGEAGGAFVVISGIVRVACESGDGVAFEDAFLGAGATCGLFTALTGVKLPGQATAVAEGNALGKGALVYHLFPSALQTIQARASGDVAGFKHVQLEMYRSAAQDMLARLAPDLTAQLLVIFRAYARLPALSDHPQPAVGLAAGHAGSDVSVSAFHPVTDKHTGSQSAEPFQSPAVPTASVGQAPPAGGMTAASAAAAQPSALGDSGLGASGLLSPSALSQMDFESIAAVARPRPSLVSFSDMASPASFSGLHFPTVRPSRAPQLPTIMTMGPIADLSMGDTSPPVVTMGQETPRSIASVRAQAGHMQQQIRQDARHGHLVVLQPQQTVQQTSHVLVMQGSISLEGCAVNSQLTPGKTCSVEFVSPTVLPWAPAARHSAGSIVLSACLQGAVVLVTPERPVQAI
ncbi:hypothetical protein WJX77_010179 [Trebouxia sp. C0004]